MTIQQTVVHFTETPDRNGNNRVQLHILTDADPSQEIYGSIPGGTRFKIYDLGQKAEVTFEGDDLIYTFTRVSSDDPAVMVFEISLIDDET